MADRQKTARGHAITRTDKQAGSRGLVDTRSLSCHRIPSVCRLQKGHAATFSVSCFSFKTSVRDTGNQTLETAWDTTDILQVLAYRKGNSSDPKKHSWMGNAGARGRVTFERKYGVIMEW